MSEDVNKDNTGSAAEATGSAAEATGSAAEAPKPPEHPAAPDERIAPGTPREEAGASTGEEAARGAPEPSIRRCRKAALIAGVAAAAIALCAVVAGIGLASGWFGDAAPSNPLSVAASTDDESTSGDEGGAHKDVAEETAEGTSEAAQDAAAEGQGAQGAPTASSSAGDAAAGGGSSAGGGDSAVVPAPEPAPEPTPPPPPRTITVSVAIDSSRAASYGYPASLGGSTVTLNQGASVYDALCATGVSVGGSSSYVTSIGGLAEFKCGPGSGWLYFVNGSSPAYGCGSYILGGGEHITWIYTCDLGNDV